MITTKQGAALKQIWKANEIGSYGYLLQQISLSGISSQNSYRLCT